MSMTKSKWPAIVGVILILLAIVLIASGPFIRSQIRSRTEAYLRARFQSDVQFTGFDIYLYPRPRVVINGLTLRLKGRTDVPPLIQIQRVSFSASLPDVLRHRYTIEKVQLDGLQIHIPPKDSGARPRIAGTDVDLAKKYPVLIKEIHVTNGLISILRADPQKPSRDFPLQNVLVQNFSFDDPATFHAQITNPIPLGDIDCAGTFGPWDADEPRHTPVDAKFTFNHADMATIKGLAGKLQSSGKFSGPLDFLSVEGTTDTPDFALRISGHPVNLHTDYTAIVDGTNGNVILKPVIAHFLHTTLVVNGEVADLTPEKGRTIALDVVSTAARIEDLLYLTVKYDKPIMNGDTTITAKLNIGEGQRDIIQRMTVDGQFGVASAHFTSPSVQEKIDSFSRRGQGRPEDTDIENVVSGLSGKFRMAQGAIDFSRLTFRVTGADVDLSGTYKLDEGQIDFHGKLHLDAKLSQTTTGAKSFLLKAVDPFFKGKNGGSELPIKITGTKDHPAYGLDLHHKDTKPAAAPNNN
jgi:AsmA-like C-terminal region